MHRHHQLTVVCLFIVAIVFPTAIVESSEGVGWSYSNSYGHLDPKHWYKNFERCNGSRQSPIDIELSDLYRDPSLKPLELSDSFSGTLVTNATLQNDGHTVRVSIPDDSRLELSSDSLEAKYHLKQFHFHWSHNDDTGSEHKVDNRYYPLELHLVHFHENLTEDGQVKFTDDSIVVLAVLFKWASPNEMAVETEELNRVIDYLNDVEDEGDNMTLPIALNISRLLPTNTASYLRYSGSLTTPPCSEVVEWIVFTHTLPVSRRQMDEFRRLRHEEPVELKQNRMIVEGEIEIEENDRPLADLNNRTIRVRGSLGDLFVEPSNVLPQSLPVRHSSGVDSKSQCGSMMSLVIVAFIFSFVHFVIV